MRLLSAFCVPSWCHFGMLCVFPGLAAAQRRLSWAEQAQHSWSVLCSDVFRVVLPANAGQQQEGCGGQMFPWTFCRTKSLKNMEGVSPWKELLHGRSFSKPGSQKVNPHGTVISMRSRVGEGLWWQVSPLAGFRCQTLSEALTGGLQHDKGSAEGHFCLRGQLEHQDISNSTRHRHFGGLKCPSLTENLGVGWFCCPALSAVFSLVFWGLVVRTF